MTPSAHPVGSHPNLLTVSGPHGMLAAVPFMLGFAPVESVLLLCLNGSRSRVGPVLRMDLPRGREAEAATAEYLAMQARQHAAAAMLVCYTVDAPRGRPPSAHPRAGLMRRCRTAIAGVGVEVVDALVVRGDRAWSYLHDRPDSRGRRVPGPLDERLTDMRCAFAAAGRAVLTDREELRAAVAGPAIVDADLAAELVTAPERLATTSAGLRRLLAGGAVSLLGRAHRLHRRLPSRAVADLLVAMDDPITRDWVLKWVLGQDGDEVLPLLLTLVRLAPDDRAAEICVVTAWAAYRAGDGALANVAVDRALACRPGHRLGRMFAQAFSAGIRPESLDGLLDEPELAAVRELLP